MNDSRVLRSSLMLALLGGGVALLLTVLHMLLAAPLAGAQRESAAHLLRQVLPREDYDPGLLEDTVAIDSAELLGFSTPQQAHIARQAGTALVAILPLRAPDGYGGAIDLLVGIDRAGRLTGTHVLSHRETPGIGDGIDAHHSPWMQIFNGRSLDAPATTAWALTSDQGSFDQLSGATISSRAVLGALKRALLYFRANRERLLAAPQPHQDG